MNMKADMVAAKARSGLGPGEWLRAFAVAVAMLAFLPAGFDHSETQDIVPPEITRAYPADGDTVDPGVYTLATVATDDREMDFVVFFVGAEMLGLVSAAQADTYRVAVECFSDTGHAHLLRAFAYDMEHNGTSTGDITVPVRR
jgi:hypothetical protein